MRYLLSQLRHRKRRALALGVAILVASASFSLLLSTVETTRLEVVGTVEKNFRPAYDILVRPRNSFTALERQEGLVRSNYLGGIFGGISYREYYRIKDLPGVQIAAPIANVGYIFPFTFITIRIDGVIGDPTGANLYRLKPTWVSNRGLSTYPVRNSYVYRTTLNPLRINKNFASAEEIDQSGNVLLACRKFTVSVPQPRRSPFSLRGREGLKCFSTKSKMPIPSGTDAPPFAPGAVGSVLAGFFPILLSAIDPAQEQELVDFSDTLTDGRSLLDGEGPKIVPVDASSDYKVVPILASTRSYVDEVLEVSVEQLDVPPPAALRSRLSSGRTAYKFATSLTGQAIGKVHIPVGPVYERLVAEMSVAAKDVEISYGGYWTSGPNRYQRASDDTLEAQAVRNPPEVYEDPYYGDGWAPYQLRDTQFRKLERHSSSNAFTGNLYNTPALRVVGRFDPELLPGFSPLSEVPLETYYPPKVEAVSDEAKRILDGRPLLPNQNLGGYVAQPPLMLTTLKGLRAMTDPDSFSGANDSTPISVIRVRVAGVRGPDPLSRERIRKVAQAINEATGLAVDVTAGSSPHPLLVKLPAGEFGRPAMTVREGWVEKGVAVNFLQAVDRKSLVLFVLVLVVCAFFLANGAFAAVAARRRELGVLSCLGWSRPEVFQVVLGEFVVVGALAGIVGLLLVFGLVVVLDLDLPAWQALLVVPTSVLLTGGAGLFPARRAARLDPMAAIAPPVMRERKARRAGGVLGMALLNLRRVPSRSLLGAAGLVVGIASFTVLITINSTFQGELAGTLLGNFISLEIRGVDLLSVGLIVALGAVSVADVVLLNVRERSAELVTLETIGRSAAELRALLTTEGLVLGALGSVSGAGLGLVILLPLPGVEPLAAVPYALGSVAIGCLLAALASIATLPVLSRLAVAETLAEE